MNGDFFSTSDFFRPNKSKLVAAAAESTFTIRPLMDSADGLLLLLCNVSAFKSLTSENRPQEQQQVFLFYILHIHLEIHLHDFVIRKLALGQVSKGFVIANFTVQSSYTD